MTDLEHKHEWVPGNGQGQYLCSCGQSGFRKCVGGRWEIAPHKVSKGARHPVTHVGGSNLPGGNARRGAPGSR